MPLAEAITQLSFLEFLQRCGVSIAPLHPSRPTVPMLCRRLHLVTSLRMCPRRRLISRSPRYLLTLQCRRFSTVSVPHPWMLPCRRSHTVLCLRTFLHRWVLAQLPRFLLMCLFRLPCAVWCYTMLPHNYRSRSSSLAVSTRTIPWTAETLFVSSRHQCKVHMPCCSRRQDSNSQPHFLSLPLSLTCLLHMVRLLTVFPVMPCSRLSVPPLWEHTMYAQPLAPKEVLVPPLREPTILLVLILVQEQVLFPNYGHWFFPWSNLGNPSLTGLVTVDSDLMHHQFRFSLLQWNPGPARRNPTNIVSAACGKFHAVILQEASDHVPDISDQFRAYTDNTDLAILLNKDTFEPDPTVLTFKADSTSKGTWSMVLLFVRGLLRLHLSLVHRLLPFAQYTFTTSWLRNVMHLLSFFSSFMQKCGSTTSTSLVVTST